MPGTVTVACKLPNGVHLDIEGKGRVTLKGISTAWGAPPIVIPGGYALTPDVDEDFWEEWLRINPCLDLINKNIVFAMPNPREARAKSKDVGDAIKTGFEPLDPDKPGPGIEKFVA